MLFRNLVCAVLLLSSFVSTAFSQSPIVATDLRLRRTSDASGTYSFRQNGDGILKSYNSAGVQTASWDAETGTFTGIFPTSSVPADDVTAGTLGTDVVVQDGSLSANIPRLNATTNAFTGAITAGSIELDGGGTGLVAPTASIGGLVDAGAVSAGMGDFAISLNGPNGAVAYASDLSSYAPLASPSFTGTATGTFSGTHSGNGAGLTGVTVAASNITAGTIAASVIMPANQIVGSTLDNSVLPVVPTSKGGTGLSTIGTANQVLRVNSGATGLEWATPAGGATWGSITGTLSSQTDLNTALNGKASATANTTLAGMNAKTFNTTGMALGYEAANSITTANTGVYLGYQAGRSVTGGNSNTHIGYQAGYAPGGSTSLATTNDIEQTLVGYQTGANPNPGDPGNGLVAVGYQAIGGNVATALGYKAKARGGSSVAIGINSQTATAATRGIAIGNDTVANNFGSMAIGPYATAYHDQSVAMGYGTGTSAANQFTIGDRDFVVGRSISSTNGAGIGGRIAAGTSTPPTSGAYFQGPDMTLTNTTAGNVPLTVKGASGQTANLLEWKNSSNSVLARVDSSGNLVVPQLTLTGAADSGTATIPSGDNVVEARYYGTTQDAGAVYVVSYATGSTNGGGALLAIHEGFSLNIYSASVVSADTQVNWKRIK